MRQMIMKTTKIFSILAVLALVLTGCQDDFGKNFKPAEVGDEIFFGGTSGYEPDGRTVYGDKTSTGTEIMWYAGDTVRIYCAEANKVEGKSYCDYTVNNVVPQGGNPSATEHDNKKSSTLTTADAYGLQWGEGADANGTHYFYGVYPSPRMFAAGSKEATNYNLNGNKLTAYLPSSQDPKAYVAAKDGNYTIHPAMRYAYMTAYSSATHTSNGVTMSFTPIVTALEISIVNNSIQTTTGVGGVTTTENISIENISGVRVSTTDGSPISGKFTADVQEKKVSSVEGSDYVTVSVRDEKNYPITLAPNKKLTFTVFMVLKEGDDLSSLKVSLLVNGVYKTATLNGNATGGASGIIAEVNKKNFINNVPLQLNKTANDNLSGLSKWMSQIKDDTPIGMLSIPGAGGATSSTLTSSPSSMQQTLDISALWDSGIRCFELMVDRDGSSDIGDNNVLCNGISTGVTLNTAVTAIGNKLKANPTEFAVVIIGYQDANYNAYERNAGPSGWHNGFNTWFSNNEEMNNYATKSYSGDIPLDDARGKIFCIARPVSMGLDAGWYTGFAGSGLRNYTVVLGWGNHPDQWYARGYGKLTHEKSADNNNYIVAHSANLLESNNVNKRPYYVNESAPESYTYYEINTNATGVVAMDKGVKSFAYNHQNKADTDYSSTATMAWVQEWKRVSNNSTKTYKGSGVYDHTGGFLGIGEKAQYENYEYQWANSVAEKKSDIEKTLILAQKGIYSLVINSLCTYYIIDSELSFKPRAVFQKYGSSSLGGYYFDDKYYSSLPTGKFKGSNLNNTGSNAGAPSNKDENGPYSWGGGFQGDIATAAADFNKFFYDKLLEIGTNNLSGPTGIVMMDRVKNKVESEDDKPGYYLPQIIIANSIRQYGQVTDDNIQ